MSKKVIVVTIDNEAYVMPIKRARQANWHEDDNLPCLHCGSEDAWLVIETVQLPMFNATPKLHYSLVVCPDCQCASEYRLTT